MLELAVNVGIDNFRIAILDNGELVKFYVKNKNDSFFIGDLYLGEVTNLSDNLNAAFVNINNGRDGFLQFSDLSPKQEVWRSFIKDLREKKNVKVSKYDSSCVETEKNFKISDSLKSGDKILVQIVKEPISSKGPKLSTDIYLLGHFIIVFPFSNEINVSRKIVDKDERSRLVDIFSSIRPNNFGLMIRTSAERKDKDVLIQDLKNTLLQWSECVKTMENCECPGEIFVNNNRVVSSIVEMLGMSFDSIFVDDKKTYNSLLQYFSNDNRNVNLKLYNNNVVSLFEFKGIERQIKLSLNKNVYLKGGGYLVIEKTEAMNVIDINTGNIDANFECHEDLVFNVNLCACEEIYRQIQLRDMGGIIAIDFVDMESAEHRFTIYNKMDELMSKDTVKHDVQPLTKSNVMLITRHRVKPVLQVDNSQACPMCCGSGKVEPTVQIADRIEKHLIGVLEENENKSVTLVVHPFIYSYFTNGILSKKNQWMMKYKKWINIKQDFSLGLMDYKIV